MHGGGMTQIPSAAGSEPKEETSKGTWRIVADMREFAKLSQLHGGLLPQSSVATVLGVTRQRVHQLVEEGTFSHWTFYGMKWLSQEEVFSFARLNRQQGENQYKPSTKSLWKDAREAAKEFVRNRKQRGKGGS
jgi:hypothetical protein